MMYESVICHERSRFAGVNARHTTRYCTGTTDSDWDRHKYVQELLGEDRTLLTSEPVEGVEQGRIEDMK
eukprot:scaffold118_cov111-Skeletonema_marinoi.AAC.3